MKVIVDSLGRRLLQVNAFSTAKCIPKMTALTKLKVQEVINNQKFYRFSKSKTLQSNLSRYFFAEAI